MGITLKPFEGGEELLEKCIACFDKIRPYYGDCLRQMKQMGHLDLVSRKEKLLEVLCILCMSLAFLLYI